MNCSLFHNDMTFPRHPICHMYLSEKCYKKNPQNKSKYRTQITCYSVPNFESS